MANELSGDVAKVRINGFPIKFATCQYEEVAVKNSLNNSETEFFSRSKTTKYTFVFSLVDASYDTEELPYAAGGLALYTGSEVGLVLYLNGLTDTVNVFNAPTFLVLGNRGSPDATNLQPWSMNGESQGVYTVPGQTLADAANGVTQPFNPFGP